MNPGINGKPFTIKLSEDWFKKGDMLKTTKYNVKLIKVYKITWCKKILSRLGFKAKIAVLKVIPIEYKTLDEINKI
jgi:hypothetical protein